MSDNRPEMERDITTGYHPEGLRAAQRSFRECCLRLQELGVPLGIREKLTAPLGQWLENQLSHAEGPRPTTVAEALLLARTGRLSGPVNDSDAR